MTSIYCDLIDSIIDKRYELQLIAAQSGLLYRLRGDTCGAVINTLDVLFTDFRNILETTVR